MDTHTREASAATPVMCRLTVYTGTRAFFWTRKRVKKAGAQPRLPALVRNRQLIQRGMYLQARVKRSQRTISPTPPKKRHCMLLMKEVINITTGLRELAHSCRAAHDTGSTRHFTEAVTCFPCVVGRPHFFWSSFR